MNQMSQDNTPRPKSPKEQCIDYLKRLDGDHIITGYGDDEVFTPSEMIDEIEKETPPGQEFLKEFEETLKTAPYNPSDFD